MIRFLLELAAMLLALGVLPAVLILALIALGLVAP